MKETLAANRAMLLRAAWMSVALGLLIEVVLVTLALISGRVPGLAPIMADVVQKVAWSTIVCVGLAFGTALAKGATEMSGLAGLLAAPLAFHIARLFHKGVSHALSLTAAGAAGPSPATLGVLKGLEYGCLGALVAWVAGRPWGRAGAHAGVGFAVGLVFGGTILALTARAAAAPMPPAEFIAKGVNELLFPVGCALVLFASKRLAPAA